MAPVIGIGGVFVRARDPQALAQWYASALGISFDEGHTAVLTGGAPEDYAVFAFFPPDSAYIGDPARQGAMVNLRVADIDSVVDGLRSAGAPNEPIQDEPYGRFTWTTDPEGNRVELWEPSAS